MSKKNNSTQKGGGVLSGLLLLVVGIGLLWYNEGRTVKTQGTINEARKNYTDVSSETIDEKYDGKLIATKGKIDINEADTLTDSKFGINVKAAKMGRVVEMYQWKENCETDDNDNKKCTYEKDWSTSLIDSSDFEEGGHTNPAEMPYENEVYISNNIKVGAFLLPEDMIKSLSYNKKKNSDELSNEYQNKVEGIELVNNYLTNVKDNNPEVGNIRISYEYLDSEMVSIMAVQTGNTFEAFTSKNGKDIYKIIKGSKTGAQILENMTKSNNFMKWLLRFIGVFLVIGAFSSMFSFITNLTDRIPILGGLVGTATGLISTVLGLAVSLIVIALAWFRFRPILSIILIAVAVVLFVCLKTNILKKKDK